jgi:hypothetical protein
MDGRSRPLPLDSRLSKLEDTLFQAEFYLSRGRWIAEPTTTETPSSASLTGALHPAQSKAVFLIAPLDAIAPCCGILTISRGDVCSSAEGVNRWATQTIFWGSGY